MFQPIVVISRTSVIIKSGNITSALKYMLTHFDLNLAIYIQHTAYHSITGDRDY